MDTAEIRPDECAGRLEAGDHTLLWVVALVGICHLIWLVVTCRRDHSPAAGRAARRITTELRHPTLSVPTRNTSAVRPAVELSMPQLRLEQFEAGGPGSDFEAKQYLLGVLDEAIALEDQKERLLTLDDPYAAAMIYSIDRRHTELNLLLWGSQTA
ncbi:MAG TPA: hypothetical protein VGL75_15040 [Acidothermaceae bacterium]